MRGTLITLGAGAAVALAFIFPGAARAGALTAAVPTAHNSGLLAGYIQEGCTNGAYPRYNQIIGTITVPDATYLNGTPGISDDFYNIGDPEYGVSGGVSINNAGGEAFYYPTAQWGTSTGPITASAPWQAQPGDKLTVVVQSDGSSGWTVLILDATNGKNWGEDNPDPTMNRCWAGAYEETNYRFLTQTTPVAFNHSIAYWQEPDSSGYGKLLGTPPAGATLVRYNLVNGDKTLTAVTSRPTASNYDFTVTDTSLRTPNWDGYQVDQSRSIGGADPYTGVVAAVVQRLEMMSTSDSTATTIAVAPGQDSDNDGFTVVDGAKRPSPPKS